MIQDSKIKILILKILDRNPGRVPLHCGAPMNPTKRNETKAATNYPPCSPLHLVFILLLSSEASCSSKAPSKAEQKRAHARIRSQKAHYRSRHDFTKTGQHKGNCSRAGPSLQRRTDQDVIGADLELPPTFWSPLCSSSSLSSSSPSSSSLSSPSPPVVAVLFPGELRFRDESHYTATLSHVQGSIAFVATYTDYAKEAKAICSAGAGVRRHGNSSTALGDEDRMIVVSRSSMELLRVESKFYQFYLLQMLIRCFGPALLALPPGSIVIRTRTEVGAYRSPEFRYARLRAAATSAPASANHSSSSTTTTTSNNNSSSSSASFAPLTIFALSDKFSYGTPCSVFTAFYDIFDRIKQRLRLGSKGCADSTTTATYSDVRKFLETWQVQKSLHETEQQPGAGGLSGCSTPGMEELAKGCEGGGKQQQQQRQQHRQRQQCPWYHAGSLLPGQGPEHHLRRSERHFAFHVLSSGVQCLPSGIEGLTASGIPTHHTAAFHGKFTWTLQGKWKETPWETHSRGEAGRRSIGGSSNTSIIERREGCAVERGKDYR